jgi:hypothetical protein
VSRVVRDLDDGGALLWIPDSKTLAGRRLRGWRCSPEGGWRRDRWPPQYLRRHFQSFPEPYFHSELKKFRTAFRGDERDRTVGLLNAIEALSQLSYIPELRAFN